MKNTGTLAFIAIIIVAVTGMLFLSNHYRNKQLDQAKAELRGRDVLQMIIDSTKNSDPVFNESLKGKIVVINVWTAKFPPCVNQIPELNRLAKEFGGSNVVFLAIDGSDSTKEMSAMKEHDIEFDYQLLFNRSKLETLIFSQAPARDRNAFMPAFPVNVVLNPDGGIELYLTGGQIGQVEEMANYLATVSGRMQ